jgi:carboxyl-terminal processing protease
MIALEVSPLSSRFANALVVYLQYLGKMVWPENLAIFYPYPDSLPLWQSAGAGLLLLTLTVCTLRERKQRPYLIVGWLWYLGTLVPVIGVLRVGQTDAKKISVVRGTIVYPDVTGRMEGQTGVIQVQGLMAGRVKEVATPIAALEKQGATKLVLDLRHCSTGPDEEGIALANLFQDQGLITYTLGQKSAKQEFDAQASKTVTKLPLVVIVNRSTAGGGEIAAAALLNSKRAQVVGERTYGDAAIRKAVTLNDGSAVILSVAKYYSPDGKSIQDNGVTPNILQAEADSAVADGAADDNLPDAAPDDTTDKKPAADELMKRALSLPGK